MKSLFLLVFGISLLAISCAPFLPPPKLEPIEAQDVKLKGKFSTGGKVDTVARPIEGKLPKPDFPFRMKYSGVEGRVRMAFAIDDKGNVTDVKALEATDRRFAEAAESTIRDWKFIPATKNGKNVGSVLILPIRFNHVWIGRDEKAD